MPGPFQIEICMSITERHEKILKKLKIEGRVHIEQLSEEMKVSTVTIRKDLKALEEMKLLYRMRGGASAHNPYKADQSIFEKASIHAEEKLRIARLALTILSENDDSIIIGSGTTAFEFARVLYPSKHLTVVTPAAKVSLELSEHEHVEILQLGGLVRPGSSSVTGSEAEDCLSRISCSHAFIGVDGIDLDFGLSITNLTETSLNQKIIQAAQKVVVLADYSKFDRRGLGKIADPGQIDFLVTDSRAPVRMIRALEDKGVRVLVTE